MKECIKVGLLGAGTVGSGVLTVLEENTAEIEKKVGVPIHVSKILVRDMKKAKELSEKYQLTDKIEDIVEDPEIDIVVELIGREHPAKEYIAAALEHKKNVVTANKDVLAKYGKELFPLAEDNKVDFMFEASVGGGIPIIRPLKSCLAANKVTSVMGIVNGTTNYMLTKMSQENMDYADVLREAQEKGYAESDPTADVGGLDAARKLVILASIAFNTRIDLSDVLVEGIDGLDLCDIEHGKELGYAIKLLAIAKNNAEHGISVCVRPTMLPVSHPLAGVNDVFNAIFVHGNVLGDAMFYGSGAGKLPTASAVVADVVDEARHLNRSIMAFWSSKKLELTDISNSSRKFFVRVKGTPETELAKVQEVFGNVQPVIVADVDGEFGFVTEVMTEAEYKAKAENFGEVLGMIRVRRVED